MTSRVSASRNGEDEDVEASQQLLGGTTSTSGPAVAGAGGDLVEARRRAPTTATGEGGPLALSTPPASPRAASASAWTATGTARRKWGCPRGGLCASALLCLALGLVGFAALRKDDSGYIDYDADVVLPEGANRASFPVSRDKKPGWTTYHESLKTTAEEDGANARVLLLGDSITEELLETSVGVSRPNWGSIEVWMEYYAYLGGINLGVAGDMTQHLLWRVQNGELPDVLQPEAIMVAIGTNNLSAGMSAEDTVTGVRALVKYLRQERPDALVVVMALFPRADPLSSNVPYPWPLIDEVNELLEPMVRLRFGTEKVRFLDCNDRFLAQDGEQQVLDSAMILPDNLHLTKEGLDAWADCAEATIHSGLG
eukprot:g4903.t1